MAKGQDSKKSVKKAPAKSAKEKLNKLKKKKHFYRLVTKNW